MAGRKTPNRWKFQGCLQAPTSVRILNSGVAMQAAKLRAPMSLFFTALLVACAGGCAAEEDEVGDGSQDIVGGNDTVESPTVYLFDSSGKAQCAGVLIGDT